MIVLRNAAPPDLRNAGPPDELAGLATANPIRLRGERNETSVLFSLDGLVGLVGSEPMNATPGREGSGLFDVRELARALLGPASDSASDRAAAVPIAGGPGFVEPFVIAPTPPDRRVTYALAGATGILAVAAAVLALMLVHDDAEANQGMQEANTGTAPETSPIAVDAVPDIPPALRLQEPAMSVATIGLPLRPETPPPIAARRVVRPSAVATPALARAPAPKPQDIDDPCSQVSCVISGYANACCAAFRVHAAPPVVVDELPEPAAPVGVLPEMLDRAAIDHGIAQIKVKACGATSSATGVVKISIKVSPAGAISAVTVRESPDLALSGCVAAAAQKAKFPATRRGGSFASTWRF